MDDTNELAGLAMQAGMIDADLAATGPQAMIDQAEHDQAQAMANGNEQQVAFILAMAVPLLGKLYPSIAEIYTDQTCGAVAGALGPVLTKYGVDLSDMGSKWGPEIAALVVCGPIAMATYQGIQSDIKASAKQVPKAVAGTGQAAPQTAQESVSLG